MSTFLPTSQNTKSKKIFLLVFSLCWFFLFSLSTEAATLSVSPQTGVHTVGSVFTTQVRINTAGQPINAAEGTLTFDTQKLQVVSVSKGPIFNLWTADPSFSNGAGTISFGGGSPSGYTGAAGSVMNVTFRAVSAGNAKVNFTSGSVLAADGLGTNVLTSMGSGAFTLAANDVPAEPEVIEYVATANTPAAPTVTSNTHPDSAGWFTEKSATLSWTLPSDVIAVRTLLDSNAGGVPTKVYESPISTITIDDLDEGVSYFHIQFKNAEGWGRVAHYRLAVDTENPTRFDIALVPDSDLSSPTQTLQFTVEDEPSGVNRYIVQIDGGEPYEFIDETGSSTHTLAPLEPGQHSVIVEAFDKAGNSIISTYSFSILAFDKPQFTEYPSQINSEVIPVIKGITRPDAAVTVSITEVQSSNAAVEYDIQSGSDGVFTFIPDSRLQNGVYEITAIAIDQHGAKSDPSDPIRIAVQDPGYIQIGSFIISILSVFIPLIALLFLSIFSIFYFLRRLRTIRSVVVAETDEALSVLDAEFKQLQKVLSEQKTKLEKSRRTKKLTRSESELIDTMHSAMQDSRKRVGKEIGDVDDIVQ